MKTKEKMQLESPSSQWKSLAWEKINVGLSNKNDDSSDLDDSKFRNAKNHYDDPHADASDLYDTSKKGGRYDSSAIEGADDPGMFVGLEVISGDQYQIEKIKVGKGNSAGYITRLVTGKAIKEPSKTKSKVDSEQSAPKENGKQTKVSEKKLSRKERNRLKFQEIIAQRKEKRAEKKRKRQSPSSDEADQTNNENNKNEKKNDKPKKKSKKSKQSPTEKIITQPIVSQEDINLIQSSWAMNTGGVYLHNKICASLHQMQFTSPTPIQASTLAASILGFRDIVGAAPTGSGKTLSYLLPILQHLLYAVGDEKEGQEQDSNGKSKLIAMILCPTRELAMQVSNEYSKLVSSSADEPYFNKIKCGSIVGGLSEQKQKRVLSVKRPPLLVGTPGRLWDLMSSGEHEHLSDLTQLRFLVIDEADRMVTQGSFPQLSNILENIRIANPSLEDMRDEESESDDDDDDDRLRGLPGVRGEAKVSMLNDDILKMIEEQRQIEKPEALNDDSSQDELSNNEVESDSEDEEIRVNRQTFIFSATLTLPSTSQSNNRSIKVARKNKDTPSVDGAIAEILEKVGAQGETKIVDLSNEIVQTQKSKTNKKQENTDPSAPKKQFVLPPGLSLYQIRCTQMHKDSHLFAFLTTTKQGSSGPCLVFCNSIRAVKRVGETMRTLGLPVRMLHAHMQQKARMSAVESLSKMNSRSIVIATDVAARGLDIPSVATVIHYDVARAPDLFVHRAGRTARGMGDHAVGWSVSLVSAAEEKNHQFICQRVLGTGNKHFDEASIDGRLLSAAQERVNLASKIVFNSDAEAKTKKSNQWFIVAANEAGLDVDEDMLDEGLIGGSKKDRQLVFEAKKARQQLKLLLAKPMRTQSFGKFLSGAGLSKSIKTELEVKPHLKKAENKSKSQKKGKAKK